MNNAGTLAPSADTVASPDCAATQPTTYIDLPAVRDTTTHKGLSNAAVTSVLVGALSAFAALVVVISEYYIDPEPPAPVAVASNAAAVSATPSSPAIALPSATVEPPPAAP